jgi:hypothetical protein
MNTHDVYCQLYIQYACMQFSFFVAFDILILIHIPVVFVTSCGQIRFICMLILIVYQSKTFIIYSSLRILIIFLLREYCCFEKKKTII